MLANYFAGRGARHIHSHVSAADHDNFLANGELISQIHVQQKINALVHTIQIDARNGKVPAAVRAHGDQHGVKALRSQVFDGEVLAGTLVQLECDVSGLQNLSHLCFHHVTGQTVLGNAQIKHSARDRGGFEDGHRISHQGQIMRGRKAYRAGPDHGNPVGQRGLLLNRRRLEVFRFRTVPLRQKAFECADLNWFVDLAAPTGALTRMSADSPADAGQGIGIASEAVCFLKPAFRDQCYVAPGISVGRARHHAGKVCVQPIPVHRLVLKTFLHDVFVSLKLGLAGQPGLSRLRLLLQGEIGGGIALHGYFLWLELLALMPCVHGVLTVGDIGDGVGAVRIRLSEIRSRRNDDKA